jgi:hypothetical protein
MSRIDPNSMRNWNDGDTMHESDYESERLTLITAINDNYARLIKSYFVLNADGTVKSTQNLDTAINFIKFKENSHISLSLDTATSVLTIDVKPGSVQTSDLADSIITTSKMVDGAITQPKLGIDIQASVGDEYTWTATDGQTAFTLPPDKTYSVGVAGSLTLVVGGVEQSLSAFTQTSPSSITTSEGVYAGTKVTLRWRKGLMPTTTVGHQSTHQKGGLDSIRIDTLDQYQELVADKIGILSGLGVFADNSQYTTLQDAINDASTKGKNRVYLSAKEYDINGLTLPSNMELIGVGMGKTILKLNNAQNKDVIDANGNSNITIRHLTIDGNMVNQTGNFFGVAITGGSNHTVEYVEAKNSAYGIAVIDASDITINQCKSHDTYYNGISIYASTVDSTNFKITNNTVYNVKSTSTPGASADGSGIEISGSPNATTKLYVRKGVIANNICHDNAKTGILVIGGDSINVSENVCYNHTINNSIGAGICISSASININTEDNVCFNNYDSGITLDVATNTSGESINFGNFNVTGNRSYGNTNAGIKNNNTPRVNINDNIIDGGLWGIFCNQNSQLSSISRNKIEGCTQNGIRLVGNPSPPTGAQELVTINENKIKNCAGAGTSSLAGIYMDYFTNVKVGYNLFEGNGKDLEISSNCSGVSLLHNLFTSIITIHQGSSIKRWVDEFRDTASQFLSDQFSGDGKLYTTLSDTFTIQHFGRDYMELNASANRISSLSTAIQSGYTGQIITLLNINTPTITIKQNANTRNMGGTDVVLSYGQLVIYTYISGTGWVQTSAVVSASL